MSACFREGIEKSGADVRERQGFQMRTSMRTHAGLPLRRIGSYSHCLNAVTAACVAPRNGRITVTVFTFPFGSSKSSNTIDPELARESTGLQVSENPVARSEKR